MRISKGFKLLLILIPGITVFMFLWLTPLGTLAKRRLKGHQTQMSGKIPIHKLNSRVTIDFDDSGIPTIKAKTELDLFRAMGLLHGRDRFFQMDILRHFGQGRLTELFGHMETPTGELVDTDVTMRGHRLTDYIPQGLNDISSEFRALLLAYVDGVNQGRRESPAIEYEVLKLTPKDWTWQDSVLIGAIQAWSLSSNWREEILRFALIEGLGENKAKALMPFGKQGELASSDASQQGADDQLLNTKTAAIKAGADQVHGLGGGSNVWAKWDNGCHLANDMHLDHRLPGVMYLQRLILPERESYGVTLPGLPVILAGKHPNFTWGVTASYVDTTDVLIHEQGDPSIESKEYEFHASVGPTKRRRIRRSPYGPIVNDLYPQLFSKDHRLASLQRVEGDFLKALEAFWSVPKMKTWDELAELMRINLPTTVNIVGCLDGKAARLSTGPIPRRESSGAFPRNLADRERDWLGYSPMEFAEDGKWIINSNNRYANGPDFLQADTAPDWRANRVKELLSIQSIEDVQLDQLSLRARKLAPILADYAPSEMQTLLSNWDYQFTKDCAACVAFTASMQALLESATAPMNEGQRRWYLRLSYVSNFFDDWAQNQNHPFWANTTRQEYLTKLLADRWKELKSELGAPKSWKWSELHQQSIKHPFGKKVDWFGFNPTPVPMAGTLDTVWKAQFYFDKNLEYPVHAGPVYRFVHSPGEAKWMIDSGRSGHPLNKHYTNLRELWGKGQLANARSNAATSLTLVPSEALAPGASSK